MTRYKHEIYIVYIYIYIYIYTYINIYYILIDYEWTKAVTQYMLVMSIGMCKTEHLAYGSGSEITYWSCHATVPSV